MIRALACGGILVLMPLVGCTRWEAYRLPEPSTQPLPISLRVWSPSGPALVLAKPFVRSDSLVGHRAGDTVAVALATIVRVERPRIDALRTTGTVVGGLAGWVAMGLLARRRD